jgi:hypothetical protein
MRFGNDYGDVLKEPRSGINDELLDRTIREYSVAPWAFVPTCTFCGKPILGDQKPKADGAYCCNDCAGLAKPGPEESYPLAE